ncbi:nucleotide sugar dehydrogenase [Leptospira sp. FAT2]|uniref:nucleotide sugar dehydrogenase n=1 Tax=Leptospira sanjuanensis TaxID=2879643 RepID=UPI001EE8CDCC|nr:nucleotide sugar dehydrogenase [Leptospira sanjuanensis]MCG6167593.1 nucleotide sugar dehydrogenase [Leptospira sanjuanensis]MCG6193012.1 nucleotide sugar dehydrogenase [Leptospira sanjuanensis]
MSELLEKINNKSAKVGIIGLGYVGLPLALRFVEEGFATSGLDIDLQKIESLKEGKSYIKHIPSHKIKNSISSGLKVSERFSDVAELDVLVICVPTPLNKFREPDLSYITNTLNTILPYLKKGQAISLESTTYPGTTEEILKPLLIANGFEIGKDFYLIYSPEREDPGNKKFDTKTIPKICSGETSACLEIAIALYQKIVVQIVPVSSTKVAEMTKLLENIHRAVNIGLVNEMKIVADRMGIDVYEVINAAATKPFGFVPYFPGPGLGGHCIPIDPFYLTWKAREYGVHTRFIELAGEVNSSMPDYVVDKVSYALNQGKKPIHGSKILVIGVSYKKNVDDIRESPGVYIMEKLRERGGIIDYSDPYIPVFPNIVEHKFNLKSVDLNPESVKLYDCILIATDHDSIDYKMILENALMIVDSRGRYQQQQTNVVRA